MTSPPRTADAHRETRREDSSKAWRRPVHVVVALGLSASAYAFSLATVARLQVEDDRDLIARREPVERAIQLLRRTHDTVEANLDRARLAYDAASNGYGSLADSVSDTQASLDALARIIAELEGIGANTPTHLSLPAIQVGLGGQSAPPPKYHATTGASGAK